MSRKEVNRKEARVYAYILIFEYIFTKETEDGISKDIIFQIQELSKIESEYIESVVHGVKEHYDELLEIISRNAKNFKLERIFRADLAALLLAVYEMKYMPDIPMNVSIAEAVEIVKSYATEKSYQFVNGVLSGVYKELNA